MHSLHLLGISICSSLSACCGKSSTHLCAADWYAVLVFLPYVTWQTVRICRGDKLTNYFETKKIKAD